MKRVISQHGFDCLLVWNFIAFNRILLLLYVNRLQKHVSLRYSGKNDFYKRRAVVYVILCISNNLKLLLLNCCKHLNVIHNWLGTGSNLMDRKY